MQDVCILNVSFFEGFVAEMIIFKSLLYNNHKPWIMFFQRFAGVEKKNFVEKTQYFYSLVAFFSSSFSLFVCA